MTVKEMSDGFDVLLNSFFSKEELGNKPDIILDEYEKSVFLTKAQEELVMSYYTGRNNTGEGFEETEEARRYLSNLVHEASLTPESAGVPTGISPTSKFFRLPDDLWFITYESASVSSDDCHDGSVLDVIPVTQDEYHKIKRNPFRGASERRVLRLDLSGNEIELVSIYKVTGYYIRYMSQLSPIILVSLPDGLSIKGETETTPCKLHEALHGRILELAVREAIMSKGIFSASNEK